MSPEQKQALIREVARWAQARKKPVPKSQEGWKILVAEYLAERGRALAAVQARARAVAAAASGSAQDVQFADGPTDMVDDGVTTQFEDRVTHKGPFRDDWDQMLIDRAHASVGPNGELLDDFDQAWQLQQKANDVIKQDSSPVSINPQSWNSGILGGSVTLPAPSASAANNTQPLIQWQGNDHETLPVVVTVMPVPLPLTAQPNGSLLGAVLRPFANIRWGTQGGQFLAKFDCSVGVQFTVNASSVYVEVGIESASTIGVTITGALSFHPSNKQLPATCTQYIQNLGAQGNSPQTRPQFATQILGVERSDDTIAWHVRGFDANGSVVLRRTFAANAYLTTPIVIPNDCVQFIYTNDDNTNSVNLRPVYGLAF